VIKLLEVPAAFAGMAMSTYTGTLLSATSTPLWAAAPRRIAAAFGASGMASGAAALRVAGLRHGASDNTGQALDLIGLAAGTLELVLLLSLRRRFREQGVDGALSETGWGLAYDLGAVAIGAGVPMLDHVEKMIESKQPPRPPLVISLAVLAGGFLLRHVLLRAGSVSAKRPKDYFRFTGGVPQ
jgi:formate-dependent nitrite reductase membrane component NrfD